MTIDDLTVNFSHLDKLTLLSDWQWLIDSSKSRLTRWISSPSKLPILITTGGNAFLQDVKAETIHLLDTVEGTVTQVSSSPQEFRGQLAVYEFVERYLSVEMVVALRQAGLHLQPTQIYSFKVPPVLGGKLEVSNLEVADIAVHFSVSGQVHQQVANVPTGTLIKNVRINRSEG